MADLLKQYKSSLEAGKVVLIPTETVYGVAANAWDQAAVEEVFRVKKRKPEKALAWLCPKDFNFARYAREWDERFDAFSSSYWPGPLTLVLSRKNKITPDDPETVGYRVPDHDFVLELLSQLEFPIVATSANISGNKAATSFNMLETELLDQLAVVNDFGPSRVSVESTVLDLRSDFKVLRPGALKEEQLKPHYKSLFS